MLVSVLIATYGSEDWRELAWSRAYPSAAAQSDDVQVFHDPEGSIASARNELAASAKGDWLCFLDADDELAPGYLDAMRAAYEQERGGPVSAGDGPPLLLTPAVRKLHNGRRGRPFNDFYPEVDLRSGNWLIIGTLVRKAVFDAVGGFENYPHGLEDWQFWAKCVKAGAEVIRVPEAVYVQHYNPRSKHWRLARNRNEYQRNYEVARASVWG